MKKEVSVLEFSNLDKKYSIRVAEDDNQKIVVAQEEGNLIVSSTFDKNTGKFVELEGSLGALLIKNVPDDKEKVQRIDEYVRYALEEYHPESEKNKRDRISI